MNTIYLRLSIFLTVFLNTHAQAQWADISISSPAAGNSIFFPSSDTGYVVNAYFPNGGEIWKTTDGTTWTNQYSISDYLFAVHFFSNEVGWVGGGQIGGGLIMKTIDGGTTWNIQNNTCEQIMSLYFISDSLGWAAATDGTQGTYFIYHTSDGGTTWTTQKTGSDYVRSVFFINETTGWVAGDNGRIFGTTDGGNTWNLLNTGVVFHFNDIYFVTPMIGWAVGTYGNGGCYKTTDGGATWVQQTIPTTEAITSVHFISENEGWICGNNGIVLKTNDGGNNWQSEMSNTTNGLNAAYFLNANVGYMAGNSGTVIKYTNPVPLKSMKHETRISIYPNPTTDVFTVNFNNQSKEDHAISLEVFDVSGKLILQNYFQPFETTKNIDISALSEGFYVLKIKTENELISHQIIKSK